MRRYVAALLAICLACSAGLVLLRPGPDVRLEAEVLQLPAEEGLALLERRRTETGFSDNLYLLNARLAAAAGDYLRAEALFRLVLTRNDSPPADVLDELARVALLSGAAADATTYLRRALEADPTPARRRTLALRYRAQGDTDRERALLADVAVAALDPQERDRLAALLVAAGDVAGYERLLREGATFDDVGAPRQRADLIALMLDQDRTADALDAARGWIATLPDPAERSAEVLGTFLRHNATEAAAAFAFDTIARDPDLGAAMPGLLAGLGQGALARAVQAAWLDADTDIDAADWDAATAFAAQTGDLTGLTRLLDARPGDAVPAEAFMVLLRYDGPAALLPYRDRLADPIADRPLLGAALAAWSGQPETTYTLLRKAARPDLSAWDREIWTQAALSLQGTAFEIALATGDDIGADFRARAAGTVPDPAPSVSPDRAAPEDTGD